VTGPRLGAVVLAAGASSRMGDAHKLLEPFGGRPMVTWAVEAALGAGARPVVVVTGARADEVEAVLPDGAIPVRNPDWREGMASSLAAGIRALGPRVECAAIALGDMPLVRPEHYRALLAAWHPGAIVVPTRDGRRGHPVLWSADHFDEIAALRGDRGARAVMDAHPGAVVTVPAPDDAVLVDVDAPGDLERLADRE